MRVKVDPFLYSRIAHNHSKDQQGLGEAETPCEQLATFIYKEIFSLKCGDYHEWLSYLVKYSYEYPVAALQGTLHCRVRWQSQRNCGLCVWQRPPKPIKAIATQGPY
jgi:hypothetical protein